MLRTSALRGRPGLLAGALLVVLLALAVLPHGVLGAPSSSSLQHEIDRQRSREGQLRTTAQRLGALEDTAAKAVAVAQGRLAEVQQQYEDAQSRLSQTSMDLRQTRERLVRLRRRLSEGRSALAASLRARYTYDPPGVVEVVLQAKGFSEVLERLNFMKRIQAHDADLVGTVRTAQTEATKDEAHLAALRRTRVRQATVLTRQRDAMASMTAGLEQRRAAVAEAHRARLAALSDTRARRSRAERSLNRLEAAQARAARQFTTPASASSRAAGPGGGSSGGPWAIPWSIVQCESGGQNVGPNSLGASGYYQFMPATWKGLGGSTPNAYQASKAEQDRLAAKLWAGGAGAGNWDCAAIVGYRAG